MQGVGVGGGPGGVRSTPSDTTNRPPPWHPGTPDRHTTTNHPATSNITADQPTAHPRAHPPATTHTTNLRHNGTGNQSHHDITTSRSDSTIDTPAPPTGTPWGWHPPGRFDPPAPSNPWHPTTAGTPLATNVLTLASAAHAQ